MIMVLKTLLRIFKYWYQLSAKMGRSHSVDFVPLMKMSNYWNRLFRCQSIYSKCSYIENKNLRSPWQKSGCLNKWFCSGRGKNLYVFGFWVRLEPQWTLFDKSSPYRQCCAVKIHIIWPKSGSVSWTEIRATISVEAKNLRLGL